MERSLQQHLMSVFSIRREDAELKNLTEWHRRVTYLEAYSAQCKQDDIEVQSDCKDLVDKTSNSLFSQEAGGP